MITKELFVNDLKLSVGLTGTSVFAVSRKEKKITRANKPYLDLTLRDRTGEVSAKVWSDSLENVDPIQVGDVVSVEFEIGNYQGVVELTLRSVKKIDDFDPADLVPVEESVDLEELKKELSKRIDSIRNIHLRQLIDKFFDDEEIYDRFTNIPAGQKIHHSHRHGLLQHTLEMLKILDAICAIYPMINHDLVVAGALLHDIGKLQELSYDLTGNVQYTKEGSLLGHINLGVAMMIERLPNDFPEGLKTELEHIILSHQGKLEYGSPVVPSTREALSVYYADEMSTYMNISHKLYQEAEGETEDPAVFSRYSKYLGTSFYLGD